MHMHVCTLNVYVQCMYMYMYLHVYACVVGIVLKIDFIIVYSTMPNSYRPIRLLNMRFIILI